jgi:hypothetical protein
MAETPACGPSEIRHRAPTLTGSLAGRQSYSVHPCQRVCTRRACGRVEVKNEAERIEGELQREAVVWKARKERRQEYFKQLGEWILPLAPWDTMFMCSFRERHSMQGAEREFRTWWRDHCHGIPTLVGVELHPGGHGGHLHGLMAVQRREAKLAARLDGTEDLKGHSPGRFVLHRSWFNLYGRCDFRLPKSAGACAGYVTKDSTQEACKDGRFFFLGVAGLRKAHLTLERRGVSHGITLSGNLITRLS